MFGMGTGVTLSLKSPCHPRVQAADEMILDGDEETRTPDLRRAKAALYQLSYIPIWAFLDSNQGPQSYQDCALAN